jgi:sulfur-oxidizing protein SoxY
MVTSRRAFVRFMAGITMLAGLWPGLGRARSNASAAEDDVDAFHRVLSGALGGRSWIASEAISLEVPPLAENGAIVPITVESRLPSTTRILIFAERNPGPLLAQFHFEPNTDAWVSLRIKLNETGPVLAIAESEGRFYGTQQQVKVMAGGCG